MMKRVAVIVLAAALISGCGARTALAPKEGKNLPMKPFTAGEALTPDQLLKLDPQAQPNRSDEQLKRSEKRRDDKFDLPPPG
jgi:PBP1b-binding outer membrane lipoprotein LpoB